VHTPGKGPGVTTENSMAQTLPDFDHHPADMHAGFELGWDYAQRGLVPPPEQLREGNPVRQGWQAGMAAFGRRTLAHTRHVRKWLQLRLNAWLRGRVFETTQVTPHYLGQIDVALCPITRQPLTHGTGGDDDASIDRVRNDAAYAAGNLVVMSTRANRAKGAFTWDEALVLVQQAEGAASGSVDGLGAGEWSRLAVLMSFVTPLPHAQAARLPLLVLPPNRLRLLNPVQGLQALVTRELGRPHWCQRIKGLADLLPGKPLRHDFNLFLNALLPRLIEAGRSGEPRVMQHAREDAWRNPLVNCRWQRFALQLDEALIDGLLQSFMASGAAGRRALMHTRGLATEGWALETRGYVHAHREARPSLPAHAVAMRFGARRPISASATASANAWATH
jgi:hypothetical protein